ncbi:MAG: PilZ domain-containing protein [bacterium]|jgi:hypothetical protein
MTTPVENRTHRRMVMEIPVGVVVVSKFRDLFIRKPRMQCMIEDVSIQGMKLATDQPIPEGAVVNLWVNLPVNGLSQAMKLRGRVCWTSTKSIASKFSAGVCLDVHFGRSVEVWIQAVRARINDHFRSSIQLGVTP